MPTIHELLADTEKQCQVLVQEMSAYKNARLLNQKAADSLEATCAALNKTAKAIAPFTEVRMRRLELIVISSVVVNAVLFGFLLFKVLFKSA